MAASNAPAARFVSRWQRRRRHAREKPNDRTEPGANVTIVRIIADDLTGALDAAAPFVATTGPLPVFWEMPSHRPLGSFALDSETRDADPSLPRWIDGFSGADLAFKKIDSLLRGRTVEEIAACLESGLFESALIAPAFPSQQRITRGGRQYWRAGAGDAWQPVDCDLMAALRRCGLPVRHASSGVRSPGAASSCAMRPPRRSSGRSSGPGSASQALCFGSAPPAWPARSPAPRR